MGGITSVTFFHFKKNHFWAFKQMGIAPFLLKEVAGLSFYKFLGTGGGAGFSLWPDFSTYAFLGVWETESDFISFSKNHPVFKTYRTKANHVRTLKLRAIHSHGKWSGVNPFIQQAKAKVPPEGDKAVVITRATLNWNRLISFWKAVPKASRAITAAKGIYYYKGIGEWPFIQQATISVWESFDAVQKFAYQSDAHAEVVKETRKKKWYKEDLFSRFVLLSDSDKILKNE